MASHAHHFVFFIFLLGFQIHNSQQQQVAQDVSALLQIKPILDNSSTLPQLLSWSISNPLCTWAGIQWAFRNGSTVNCSSLEIAMDLTLAQHPNITVTGIDSSTLQQPLSGSLPPEIGLLSNLQQLNLSNNNLTGPIPASIATNTSRLTHLYLSSNHLNGTIPSNIWNLCTLLQELHLDHNALSGSIPLPLDTNSKCPTLTSLFLDNNHLTGTAPVSFLRNFAPNLTQISLANNTFFTIDAPANAPAAPAIVLAAPVASNPQAVNPMRKGMAAGAVAGIIIGVLITSVLLLSLLIGICSSRKEGFTRQLSVSPSLRQEIAEAEEQEPGSGKLVHFEGGERLNAEEVLNASGEVLGKTSYGTVYKAQLQTGSTITLRLLRDGTVKEKDEFVSAVKELGLIRHRNLIPLRAYYHGPKDEKLLVYDYMPKGSLLNLLHKSTPYSPAPDWTKRHKIAMGIARGLAHLHTGLHLPLIHGNLKSKNILVDDNFEPHLSDYGLYLLMTNSACNDMLNAASQQGYKAPELNRIKKANTKTDIYSLGIIVLELLTGKKAGNLQDGGAEDSSTTMDLPTVVKTAVLEERTSELFDLELLRGMRTPAEDGLLQALQLAMGCCAPSPAVRPDIKEVIKQLEHIRPKPIQSPIFTPPSFSRNFTPSRSPLHHQS